MVSWCVRQCQRHEAREWAFKMGDDDGGFSVNQYQVGKLLGAGAYGEVRLASDTAGKQYAVKCLSRSFLKKQREFVKSGGGRPKIKTALQDVQREIAIMKKTEHKNLVKMVEAIDIENKDQMFIILEFIQGGQSMYYNSEKKEYACKGGGVYSEDRAKGLYRDLVEGLRYLHAQLIIHRDLKPENLLLTEDGTLKLADFGIAQKLDVDGTKSMSVTQMKGTFQFMSPEMIKEQKYDGFKVDIWASGVCLYIFLHGKLPFWGDTPEEVFDVITEKSYTIDDSLSADFKAVLPRIMEKDPAKRITLDEIVKTPYFGFDSVADIAELEVSQDERDNAITPALNFSQVVNLKIKMGKWKEKAKASAEKNRSKSSMESGGDLAIEGGDSTPSIASASAPQAPAADEGSKAPRTTNDSSTTEANAVKTPSTTTAATPASKSCCVVM